MEAKQQRGLLLYIYKQTTTTLNRAGYICLLDLPDLPHEVLHGPRGPSMMEFVRAKPWQSKTKYYSKDPDARGAPARSLKFEICQIWPCRDLGVNPLGFAWAVQP